MCRRRLTVVDGTAPVAEPDSTWTIEEITQVREVMVSALEQSSEDQLAANQSAPAQILGLGHADYGAGFTCISDEIQRAKDLLKVACTVHRSGHRNRGESSYVPRRCPTPAN